MENAAHLEKILRIFINLSRFESPEKRRIIVRQAVKQAAVHLGKTSCLKRCAKPNPTQPIPLHHTTPHTIVLHPRYHPSGKLLIAHLRGWQRSRSKDLYPDPARQRHPVRQDERLLLWRSGNNNKRGFPPSTTQPNPSGPLRSESSRNTSSSLLGLEVQKTRSNKDRQRSCAC